MLRPPEARSCRSSRGDRHRLAAAALYVLLPADIAPGYATFLILFVAAISRIRDQPCPGGLGVLEATILLGLGAGTRPDVVASLVLFRLIYYALPFLLAALGLAAFELYRARLVAGALAGRSVAFTRRLVPPVAGSLVLSWRLRAPRVGESPGHRRADGLPRAVPCRFPSWRPRICWRASPACC